MKLPCLIDIEAASGPVGSLTLGMKSPSWDRCVGSSSRKTWVVILAAGADHRSSALALSRDGRPIPSQFHYCVEHESVLLGLSSYAPDAGFGDALPNADSGVGMRPLPRWVAARKEDCP